MEAAYTLIPFMEENLNRRALQNRPVQKLLRNLRKTAIHSASFGTALQPRGLRDVVEQKALAAL